MRTRFGIFNANYSRRRFVRTAAWAAGAVPAVALVGCGDDDDKADFQGVSGLSGTPTAGAGATATAAPIKRGGTWRGAIASDPTSLDPLSGSSFTLSLYGSYVYSRLIRSEAGRGVDPQSYATKMDLAQSVERVDGSTYVVKLGTKAKFHAPLGRVVDAADVKFSYERQKASAAGLVNDIDSVEVVDATTVRFKLKAPNAEFLNTNKGFLIMPKEAGTAFDPATTMVGTGPWIFEKYTAGSVLSFRRNPEWHLGPDAPYLDRVELAIVPEYATRLSQFMGGNIEDLDVQGNDLSQVVKTIKGVQVYRGELQLPWSYMSFSGNPADSNAPWRDERVRRAISMSLDRDAMTEAAYNVSKLREAIPGLEVRWNNVVPASTTPYWLDPKGAFQFKPSDPKMSEKGLSSFRYDPKEAMALLSAAGHPDGFSVDGGGFAYPIARYGEPFRIISELVPQYLSRTKMNFKSLPEDYTSKFASTSLLGDFKGMIHVAGGGGYPLFNSFGLYYLPGAIRNNGRINDPKLTSMVQKTQASFDAEDRRVKMLEMQQYINEAAYYLPGQTGAVGSFISYQPNLVNVLDYQVTGFDQGNETMPYYSKTAG